MSMKMTMAEFVGLELCPFCKGEAFYNPEYNGGCVECRECGAEGPYKRTEAEAIAAWNSRAERTCQIIGFDNGVDEGIDGEWHQYAEPQYDLSCGHSSQGVEAPNYCPNCGAKVIERKD